MLKLGTTQRGPCGGLRGEIDKGDTDMSDTRYPTRMHEVLGVEGEEIFTIKGSEDELYLLDVLGTMNIVNNDRPVTPWEYRCAIVNGIIRKPRLSEEQVKQFKALHKALKGQVADIVQTLRDAGVEVDDG